MFDPAKLEWMNGVYLRALEPGDFVARALPFVETTPRRPLEPEETDRVVTLAPLVQERVKRLDEVGPQVAFLFDDVVVRPGVVGQGDGRARVSLVLARAMEALRRLEPWSAESIEEALRRVIDELGLSARKGLQPLRVAVTGSAVSPPLFESIAVLGRVNTARAHRSRQAAARPAPHVGSVNSRSASGLLPLCGRSGGGTGRRPVGLRRRERAPSTSIR